MTYPVGKPAAASEPTLVVVYTLAKTQALQVIGEAYKIADITQEIIARDVPHLTMYNVNNLQTRVPWEAVLQHTFGEKAQKLMRLTADLGSAIGCAARLFAGFVTPSTETERLLEFCHPTSWYGYGSRSYGQGFLHFVCTTFPELAPMRSTMENAARKTFSAAFAEYQAVQERLRSTCNCLECRYGYDIYAEPSKKFQPPCLRVLCAFVIRLSLDLSVTTFPSAILPTRSGLEELYLDRSLSLDTAVINKDPVKQLFDKMSLTSAQIAVLTVFTGFRIDQTGFLGPSAFVKYGICLYLGVLRTLSDVPEEMARIHIIPGHIENRTGRQHETLNDTMQYRTPRFNFNAGPATPCNYMPKPAQRSTHVFAVQIVVHENVSNLSIHFIITKNEEEAVCSPDVLMTQLLKSCGLSRSLCNNRGCPKLDIGSLSVATIHGEGRLKNGCLTDVDCRIGLRMVDKHPVARL